MKILNRALWFALGSMFTVLLDAIKYSDIETGSLSLIAITMLSLALLLQRIK